MKILGIGGGKGSDYVNVIISKTEGSELKKGDVVKIDNPAYSGTAKILNIYPEANVVRVEIGVKYSSEIDNFQGGTLTVIKTSKTSKRKIIIISSIVVATLMILGTVALKISKK